MPHGVHWLQDSKDPSVQHPILTNVGPLGIKKEEPDANRLPLKDRSWVRLDEKTQRASLSEELQTRERK